VINYKAFHSIVSEIVFAFVCESALYYVYVMRDHRSSKVYIADVHHQGNILSGAGKFMKNVVIKGLLIK